MTTANPHDYTGKRWYLYRLFDIDGRLLYVGITINPAKRIRSHQTGKWWGSLIQRTDIRRLPEGTGRVGAESIERKVIGAERPEHNVLGVAS